MTLLFTYPAARYAEDLVISLRDDLEAEKKLRMEAQTVYHQTLEDIMEISKVTADATFTVGLLWRVGVRVREKGHVRMIVGWDYHG